MKEKISLLACLVIAGSLTLAFSNPVKKDMPAKEPKKEMTKETAKEPIGIKNAARVAIVRDTTPLPVVVVGKPLPKVEASPVIVEDKPAKAGLTEVLVIGKASVKTVTGETVDVVRVQGKALPKVEVSPVVVEDKPAPAMVTVVGKPARADLKEVLVRGRAVDDYDTIPDEQARELKSRLDAYQKTLSENAKLVQDQMKRLQETMTLLQDKNGKLLAMDKERMEGEMNHQQEALNHEMEALKREEASMAQMHAQIIENQLQGQIQLKLQAAQLELQSKMLTMQLTQEKLEEHQKDFVSQILNVLAERKIISRPDADCSFKLNKNGLTVNGVKQPDDLYQLFKEKYIPNPGDELTYSKKKDNISYGINHPD